MRIIADKYCKVVELPDESRANPYGYLNVAADAGPLSPLKLVNPVPASKVIIDAVTLRTRLLTVSEM